MNLHTIATVPELAPAELEAMHHYCLQYRDLVRGGGMPSTYQSLHFMLYQVICYAAGVAYGA